MPKTAITREVYDRLVEGWLHNPDNATAAGKVAGLTAETAKRGYERGWLSGNKPWAKPIKDVLASVRQQARSESMARHEAARANAVATLTREAQIVAGTRDNTMALVSVTARLLRGALPLADKVREALEKETIALPLAARILRDIANTARATAVAVREVLEAERFRLGDPRAAEAEAEELSNEEILAELRDLDITLEEVRRRGLLTVISGGRSA